MDLRGKCQLLIRIAIPCILITTYIAFQNSSVTAFFATHDTTREHNSKTVKTRGNDKLIQDLDVNDTQTREDRRNYVTPHDTYLYSAFIDPGQNLTKKSKTTIISFKTEGQIIVIAWQNRNISQKKVKCCILYRKNTVKTSPEIESSICCYKGTPNGRHVVCPLKGDKSDVIGISLADFDMTCSSNVSHYITPTIQDTELKKNKMAVCIHSNLYGSLSAKRLVEWFEIHRYLGVDRFTCHPHPTLNSLARRVLRFYEKEGLLESFELENPKETLPRGVRKYRTQQWNDEQVGLLDCRERHKYYEFITDFDPDELLLPAEIKENVYKTFLVDKFRQTKLGVLAFYNHYHVLTWKSNNNTHPLFFGRYENATIPIENARKNVYMPSRVRLPEGMIHKVYPKSGFKKEYSDPDKASIHHFRTCRDSFSHGQPVYQNGRIIHVSTPCDRLPRLQFEPLKHLLNSTVILEKIQRVWSVLKLEPY